MTFDITNTPPPQLIPPFPSLNSNPAKFHKGLPVIMCSHANFVIFQLYSCRLYLLFLYSLGPCTFRS